MKFAHLADIHLGSWREPKLRELNTKAFVRAITKCVSENVDFVLISGDLFNTSLPPIESLKIAVTALKKLKDKGIPVYTIAGSHDFSASGKTMLDVLEEAGLVMNVFRGDVLEGRLNLDFTVDMKTGAKIAGMIGKKGMLEKRHYEDLIRSNLEQEEGFKIFMFHTALAELRPPELEKMEAAPVSLLPRGFDYYAGGHVHIVEKKSLDGYKNVVYPGPLFPNSFSELQKLKHGGFYIYDDGNITYEPVKLSPVVSIDIDCDGKTPSQVTQETLDAVKGRALEKSILLLRLTGMLASGRVSDIDNRIIFKAVHENGAYFFMKNTNRLTSKDYEEPELTVDSTDEAEQQVIDEHLGQVKSLGLTPQEERSLVSSLMSLLDTEREEGEKVSDYESRIIAQVSTVFEKENPADHAD